MYRILIIGGGFGGVTAAKHLQRLMPAEADITLVSKKPGLEYFGVLYRLIGGADPDEALIPLKLMLNEHRIDLMTAMIDEVNTADRFVKVGSDKYYYDTLILAPGSVPAFFNIPGMEEHAVTMYSVDQALALHTKVIGCLEHMKTATGDERASLGRFVIVGAGPTGIEIAGEILPLARRLARKNGIDPSLISVDLVEAMDRLLPAIEPDASAKVRKHLEQMGIHIHLNTMVAGADANGITLKDGSRMDAKTIVWTAGVAPSPLLKNVPGLQFDKRGRVMVDEFLQAQGKPEIIVIGDCASTPYAGMAQTAVTDGKHAARVIAAKIKKQPLPVYKPVTPAYAIPAGPNWAAVKFGPLRVYGFLGHMMRRAADAHVYQLLLPLYLVPIAFFGWINNKKP